MCQRAYFCLIFSQSLLVSNVVCEDVVNINIIENYGGRGRERANSLLAVFSGVSKPKYQAVCFLLENRLLGIFLDEVKLKERLAETFFLKKLSWFAKIWVFSISPNPATEYLAYSFVRGGLTTEQIVCVLHNMKYRLCRECSHGRNCSREDVIE